MAVVCATASLAELPAHSQPPDTAPVSLETLQLLRTTVVQRWVQPVTRIWLRKFAYCPHTASHTEQLLTSASHARHCAQQAPLTRPCLSNRRARALAQRSCLVFGGAFQQRAAHSPAAPPTAVRQTTPVVVPCCAVIARAERSPLDVLREENQLLKETIAGAEQDSSSLESQLAAGEPCRPLFASALHARHSTHRTRCAPPPRHAPRSACSRRLRARGHRDNAVHVGRRAEARGFLVP